jgi:serpin B
MRRWSGLLLMVGLGCGVACNGTSTGNPMESPGTAGKSGGLGEGMQLLMSSVPRDMNPAVSADDVAALAADNRAFAFDLYRRLATAEDNLFFSPFSISVALGMTYPGARETTKASMSEVLHFNLPEPALHSAFNSALSALQARSSELAEDSKGSGFELRAVNQAFGQRNYPFLEPYLDVLAQHYGSGLVTVDFARSEEARVSINDWVAQQTETRVKDLLPTGALTGDTRLVLTNAIYFKANWLSQFEVEDTVDAPFRAPAGTRTVPMMKQLVASNYAEGEGYQAVELPYLSPAVRMLLILPAEGELAGFSERLDDAVLSEVIGELREHEVTLALPRFSFESETRLKAPLQALGMSLPFEGDADFSAIAGGIEPLWIDEAYHKAFVAVDEKGTEAAAATAVVISTESAKPLASITFDHPFVFCIYDQPTGQILFLGQLADPG